MAATCNRHTINLYDDDDDDGKCVTSARRISTNAEVQLKTMCNTPSPLFSVPRRVIHSRKLFSGTSFIVDVSTLNRLKVMQLQN